MLKLGLAVVALAVFLSGDEASATAVDLLSRTGSTTVTIEQIGEAPIVGVGGTSFSLGGGSSQIPIAGSAGSLGPRADGPDVTGLDFEAQVIRLAVVEPVGGRVSVTLEVDTDLLLRRNDLVLDLGISFVDKSLLSQDCCSFRIDRLFVANVTTDQLLFAAVDVTEPFVPDRVTDVGRSRDVVRISLLMTLELDTPVEFPNLNDAGLFIDADFIGGTAPEPGAALLLASGAAALAFARRPRA